MKFIIKLYINNKCVEKSFSCFAKGEDDEQIIDDLINILNEKRKKKIIDKFDIIIKKGH